MEQQKEDHIVAAPIDHTNEIKCSLLAEDILLQNELDGMNPKCRIAKRDKSSYERS